ncbi:MAG: DUF2817 domain-containing protein [Candidatus Nanopelagicales bacterium]|nr:DUF2817 domain-containing protein [Candidatus Nanopelagicales bacterium]
MSRSLATGVGSTAVAVLAAVVPLGAIAGPAAAVAEQPNATAEESWPDKVVVGKSAQGRPIVAQRQGNPAATKVLLVVGQMHGDEPKGPVVVRSLRKRKVPVTGDVAIWSISTINPDGQARRRRVNARSVDLNRNFPTKWRLQGKGGGTYSGPKAVSERETKEVMAFVSRLRPDAIMSFHQPLNTVMAVCDPKARPWVRLIGRLAGLPVPNPRNCKAANLWYPGTFNKWYTAHFPGWFATVELPASSAVNRARIRRYTNTIVRIAALMEDAPGQTAASQ